MHTQNDNQNINLDDSLEQQIKLNEIHKSLSLDCAGYFLTESASRLRLNSDLPYSPEIIAAHALIAHKEWLHYIDRDRMDDFKQSLDAITDGINGIGDTVTAFDNNFGTYSKNIVESLHDVVESIDCAGATTNDFWMTSELAAIDKAQEVGLSIPPEWSMADLRYKLHQAIYGGEHG